MSDFFKFLSTAIVVGAFFALAVQYGWAVALFGLMFAVYIYRTKDDE